jgi:transposase
MPADFHKKLYILPKFTDGQYHALMVYMRNAMGFEQSDVAQFRLKALNHLYEYGCKAARDAYGVKRSTVFSWKKRFEESKGKLSSLVPQSTKPHRTRQMSVDLRLQALIKSIREEHGNIGKAKLKPFVDALAKNLEVKTYGYDKINKIVVRNHYFFDKPKRKKPGKKGVSRIKRTPTQTTPGYLQMDSVTLWVLGQKLYFITIIDVYTKYAWCKVTKSLTSRAAKEALKEFMESCPYPVREIQTDNGHEFLDELDQYLESLNIPHNYIYPRSPKINGVVERFNRTLKDEFLNRCDEVYTRNWEKLDEKLASWLVWYNTQRPHYSLKYMTPKDYMQQFKT